MAATIEQLEERLRLAKRVHEQLETWNSSPPKISADDWSGPAAVLHERTAEKLRAQLSSATTAAGDAVLRATTDLADARG
ncbi:hypothetical protein GCM10027515_07690 [Schumannella luteola]|uniref:Uncharacterized protein n=1 Tax=Schumannella luteola TaxID=472059 RepID=A0A852YA70_9MICO|nr:hypothetical protein [Schumannella luteola]NYG98101.1 hypothetical protein [Schumannella luteola]TPX01824.1 hypothetical protein FJ656_25900 [Schumannella luteola]